ncbi:uncharacterized protein [Diabrotica undecimpunctata]|uniref:uncharacterized protein n=1 Tax=Diabrotica undecimpunctata TaxID=50387 RepID=UPI003B63276B
MSRHLLTLSKIFYGLTSIQLRKEAFAYAEKLNLKHSFNREKQKAGKDWLYGFMSRHPELSFRKPEATSLNRIQGFNKDQVSRFYDNLGKLYDEYKFQPTRIFETGITNVNRPNRIIGPIGQKQVRAVTSGERGKNVTVCCCMSASGSFTPPLFIYPRLRRNPALEKDGPPGSFYSCSKSGWMNEEVFLFWIQHFAKTNKPTRYDPILLVLDNYSSHCSIAIYNFCKENGIIMLSIPPLTSHRLQPLDVSFFSSLKRAYDVECDSFLKSQPYEKIEMCHISPLFSKEYTRVASIDKAANGFEKTGIFPFNRNTFNEEDFYSSNDNQT